MRMTKRRLIRGLAGMIGVAGAAPALAALQPTPRQTQGPFYPRPADLYDDRDNDLVKIEGVVKQAGGEILHLSGQVKDRKGNILRNARVEIWQCDVNGRYLHGRDWSLTRRRDAAFQGYGETRTDDGGMFRFRTIKPVPYPGRTPHIHAKIHHPQSGSVLTTQFYIAGDKGNSRDGLFLRLANSERKSLSMDLQKADNDEWRTRIDVVL